MAHGKSLGKVDDKFKDRISDLEEYARDAAEQFKDWARPRSWAVPKVMISAQRDLLDVPGLHQPAWDRNKINEQYSEEALKGPGIMGGTVGDLIALKWQADFMAAEERAFRLRHATPARCAALMHGRLDGHGKQSFGIFSFLKDGVQEYIDLGKAHGAKDGFDGYQGDVNPGAAAGLA